MQAGWSARACMMMEREKRPREGRGGDRSGSGGSARAWCVCVGCDACLRMPRACRVGEKIGSQLGPHTNRAAQAQHTRHITFSIPCVAGRYARAAWCAALQSGLCLCVHQEAAFPVCALHAAVRVSHNTPSFVPVGSMPLHHHLTPPPASFPSMCQVCTLVAW